MTDALQDTSPTPDRAEYNAFFPSPFSLSRFTVAKTGAQPVRYDNANPGGRWKVLMVGADERYMTMANGRKFSTGNHPVETLLPLYHIDQAGFQVDVATVSGQGVKLEMWAMPGEDDIVLSTHQKYLAKLENPLRLSDVVARALGPDSPYLGVFLPGGHGAMLGLPQSPELGQVLRWAVQRDKLVIALCHGPASLLAAQVGAEGEPFAFQGYELCAFPDALDRQTPAIGYVPGPMPWYMGERLTAQGMKILNTDISGRVHQDRLLVSGDSPLASDAIGRLAVEALRQRAA